MPSATELKVRAKLLRPAIADILGLQISTAQALELVAREENFPNWDAASACSGTTPPAAGTAPVRSRGAIAHSATASHPSMDERFAEILGEAYAASNLAIMVRYDGTSVENATVFGGADPAKGTPCEIPADVVRAAFNIVGTTGVGTISVKLRDDIVICTAVAEQTDEGETIAVRMQPLPYPAEKLFAKDRDLLRRIDLLEPYGGGLALIVGATGSGRSTTLASLATFLNRRRTEMLRSTWPVNVVAFASPTLARHADVAMDDAHSACTYVQAFLQGQYGHRFTAIVLFEEIRDRETAKQAVHLAEAGHIVLASLHAASGSGALAQMDTWLRDDSHWAALKEWRARLVVAHQSLRDDSSPRVGEATFRLPEHSPKTVAIVVCEWHNNIEGIVWTISRADPDRVLMIGQHDCLAARLRESDFTVETLPEGTQVPADVYHLSPLRAA